MNIFFAPLFARRCRRDDNNEPTKLAEFDEKMLTMRQGGFSPHKSKIGFKPKHAAPTTPTKQSAAKGQRGGRGKGGARDKGHQRKEDRAKEDAAAGLEQSMLERTRRVQESAKKVLGASAEPEDGLAEGEDFTTQVAALLSLVEMGKE